MDKLFFLFVNINRKWGINLKNEKPLVSIILPVYNVEKYLPKCMESIFLQTYSNIEIIIVDDGSNKECAELCDKYLAIDQRVSVFHKSNGGLSDARNYGIMRAKGEYITCIDSDDFVDKTYVEYLVYLILKYKSKMAICQHRFIYDNGKVQDKKLIGDELLSSEQCLESMLYNKIIDTSAWAKLYQKRLFDNVKYPKGRIFEDIGTTYALMLQCDYIAVGYESKYNYVYRQDSIVNDVFNPKKLDLLYMTDKMAESVIIEYPNLNKAIIRRRVYSRFSTLNQLLSTKGFDNEKKECITFIMNNRKNILTNGKAPLRDKMAILLLSLGFKNYQYIWLMYKKKIMKK